jgi:hypothetical protein
MRFLASRRAISVAVAWSVVAALAAGEGRRPKNRNVVPAAILAFVERGDDLNGLGGKVTDLLFADLVGRPEMFLVDRDDLQKLLDEQTLSASGLVKPSEANRLGQLTGAKLLITGSVIQVDASLYLVAKIIGTETSRVRGVSVKGKVGDDPGRLVAELAGQIARTVAKEAGQLVAPDVAPDDRIARLRSRIGRGERPAVLVEIGERHVGQPAHDPAAQTELALLCERVGFSLIDPDRGTPSEADVLITGEGLTEFAARHGDLVAVKGRLEVKAIDRRTGRILVVDRQTSVAVDLTEQIAGKTAMQDAAAALAERLLPAIVEARAKRENRP